METLLFHSPKKSANVLSVKVRLQSATKLNQRSGIHTEAGFRVTVAMVVAVTTVLSCVIHANWSGNVLQFIYLDI